MSSKLSVIVPIYNGEEFLRECILHIVNQTYKNLEIILVNDGSTDNSGKIIQEFCEADSRVYCIDKENKGVSNARNVGVKAATGEYITFVDADDYPDIEMFEVVIDIMEKYAASIGVCSYYRNENCFNETIYDEKMDVANAFLELVCDNKFGSYSWGKIYKRNLFEGIEYPEGRTYEDIFTTYKLINKVEFIAYTNAKMYFYRVRRNSITTSRYKKQDINLVYASSELWTFLKKEHYESAAVRAKDSVTRNAIALIRKMFAANQFYANQVVFLCNVVREGYPRYLKSQYKITSKLLGVLICICPKGTLEILKYNGRNIQ